jgi:hypothetical protein
MHSSFKHLEFQLVQLVLPFVRLVVCPIVWSLGEMFCVGDVITICIHSIELNLK